MKNLLFFFLLLPVFVGAQNLVPNPSFEDTVACPWDLDLINYCSGWSSYGNTPDYFNPCTFSPNVNVPQNLFGFQFPASGNSYAGVITFDQSDGYREILGKSLSSPLVIGTKYYVSMKVNFSNRSLFSTNKIGISFSTVSYNWINNTAPINNQATVYSASIINDTANWVIVRGSFIADSLYQYIMIGNFFDDLHTDTLRVPNGTIFDHIFTSYYYIDDVCLSIDSMTCELGTKINPTTTTFLSIYPNPTDERIYINADQPFFYLTLYSVLGVRLKSFYGQKGEPISLSEIPSGIYFIKVESKNKILQQRIIIQH